MVNPRVGRYLRLRVLELAETLDLGLKASERMALGQDLGMVLNYNFLIAQISNFRIGENFKGQD